MRLNLYDEDFGLVPLDDKGFIELRKFGGFKRDIDYRSAHGENSSVRLRRLCHREDHTNVFRLSFDRMMSVQRVWRKCALGIDELN